MRKDAHPQYSFRSCTSLNSRGLVLCVRNVERTPLAISGMTLRSVYSRAGNAAMLSTEYWMFGKCEELVQNCCFYRAMRSGRTIILSPIEEKNHMLVGMLQSKYTRQERLVRLAPPAPKSRKQSAVLLPCRYLGTTGFQLGLGLAAFGRAKLRTVRVAHRSPKAASP